MHPDSFYYREPGVLLHLGDIGCVLVAVELDKIDGVAFCEQRARSRPNQHSAKDADRFDGTVQALFHFSRQVNTDFPPALGKDKPDIIRQSFVDDVDILCRRVKPQILIFGMVI